MFQTFYSLVARSELSEDEMPIEFLEDRKIDFVNYSELKPLSVSCFTWIFGSRIFDNW